MVVLWQLGSKSWKCAVCGIDFANKVTMNSKPLPARQKVRVLPICDLTVKASIQRPMIAIGALFVTREYGLMTQQLRVDRRFVLHRVQPVTEMKIIMQGRLMAARVS